MDAPSQVCNWALENGMTQIDSGSNLRSDLQYLVSFPIGCQSVVAAILQVIPT